MYYVSYIEEYPIYEAAEGGYFYAGESVVDVRTCKTWRKAKRIFNEWRRWFEREYEGCANVYHNDFGGCNRFGEGSFICCFDKYIGNDRRVQITNYKPHDKGRVPYC